MLRINSPPGRLKQVFACVAKTVCYFCCITVIAGLIFAVSSTIRAPHASAARSTSYIIDAEPGTVADGDRVASPSYQIGDVSLTWRDTTGQSVTYREAPPTTDPITDDDDSGAGGASGGTPGGTENPGGHRGHGTIYGGATSSVMHSSAAIVGARYHRAPTAPHGPNTIAPQPTPADAIMIDLLRPAAQAAPLWDWLPNSSSIDVRDGFDIIDPIQRPILRATSPIETPCLAPKSATNVLLLALLITALCSLFGTWIAVRISARRTPTSPPRRRAKHKRTKRITSVILSVTLSILLTHPLPLVHAATVTTPQTITYNGQLRDSGGAPITADHVMRFSFWSSPDVVPSDTNPDGSINIAAGTYAGWQENQIVRPDAGGYFSMSIGSGTALPSLASLSASTLQNLHLQVEVKQVGAPDTTYEILDVNAEQTTIDRSAIHAVPFALNADMLDQRDTGTGSGNIAVLGSGGLFLPSMIPGGTNAAAFAIDGDGSETGDIALQFGASLSRQLTYDIASGRFNFSDDVRIEGNLTVTGFINGVDVTALSPAQNTHLRASSGAGLTLNIAGGSYRLRGAVADYGGATGVAVQNNATNYVFFGSGGLSVSTVGFPTDESAIRVAEVTTASGSITALADRRILQTDDRERTIEQRYDVMFDHAAYQGDATDNIGQLSVSHDGINLRNFYRWTSTKATLQDYDIILRIPVPTGFVGWGDNALALAYRSTSDDAANSKLDLSIFDTNGDPVVLSGSTANLRSLSWATAQVEFTGAPTWTAGQNFILKLKVSAKGDFQMHIGDLKVRMRELAGGQ